MVKASWPSESLADDYFDRLLEQESEDPDDYMQFVQYELTRNGHNKVKEAKELITDQADLFSDF